MRRISESLAEDVNRFANQGPPKREDFPDDESYQQAARVRATQVQRLVSYLGLQLKDACPDGCRVTVDDDNVTIVARSEQIPFPQDRR